MSERIGVAFLVDSLGMGGAEKHTVQLFNALDTRKFRLGLVYLKRKENLLAQIDHGQGHVWCADVGRGWDRIGWVRLSHWMQNFSPDIVAAVNTYPLFYAHMAAWKAGVNPHIVEIFHSCSLSASERVKMHLVYNWFFNLSDRVVYLCDYQRRYWEKRGIRKRIGIRIYNGVDTRYFTDRFNVRECSEARERVGFHPEDFVVGICAVLRPEKKHEELLLAQHIARKRGLRIKTLIIGDGTRRAYIEKRIAELSLQADARITGFAADVRPFLAACDCMAIVSKPMENFPIAVLEAMSMGKPVIAAEIGGIPEQIVSGKSGLLFKVGDIDGLVDCLFKMKQPEARARMGEAAKERVRGLFTEEEMLQGYAALFETLRLQGNETSR